MNRPRLYAEGTAACALSLLLALGGAEAWSPARADEERALAGHLEDLSPGEARLEALCGPRLAPRPDPDAVARRGHPDTPLELEAEEVILYGAVGRYELRGEAFMRRLDQWLTSDEATLDDHAGRATVPGSFHYQESGLNLMGASGRFNLDTDTMDVEQATFRFWEDYAHGDAARLRAEPGLTALDDLRYSTCPPDRELWWMRAESLDLDHEAGEGRARHARVEIGGVPVFYAPYLSFPIDDRRRTGVLPPRFGNDGTHGWHARVPVYLNLAPNYDATVFPTWYQRRGEQLGGQYRYLQRSFEGQVGLEYLPDDQLAERDRWQALFDHSGELPWSINYSADVNRVSDDDYLRDFTSDLISSSPSELESRFDVGRSVGSHAVNAEAIHYQTLRGSPSLRRLPRVTYDYTPGRIAGFDVGVNTEAVAFRLPDSGVDDTGRRYHAETEISRDWRGQAYFVEPAAILRHTRYDADRADPDDPSNLTRTIPTFSLDSGIFLERPYQFGERLFMQTLEPRLFYLYTPFEDQDDLPVFETRERSLNVSQLFSTNRFTGVDRIGDADQISASITSRFLDVFAGREYARASVGQVYFRRDREVTLDGDIGEEQRRSRSNIFGELDLNLPAGFEGRAEYVHDPDASEQVSGNYRLRWQARPRPGSIMNVDYRRTEARQDDGGMETTREQIDASTVVSLGPTWSVFGAVQHSLLEDTVLDLAGGFEYRTCCWTARATARRYQRGSGTDLEPENTFMVEFDLRGLASFGDDTESFLRDVVRGYDETVF